MFDTIYPTRVVETGPSHVSVEHIYAATSEQARLLKELEDEAHKKWQLAVQLDTNSLACKVFWQRDLMNMQLEFLAIFDINGKRIEIRDAVSDLNLHDHGVIAYLNNIFFKKCAELIASQMLIKELSKKFEFNDLPKWGVK